MINYGAHMTIKFGCCDVKEYFNIANVEYYDEIPDTPFLRGMGITLDFKNPGMIQRGNEIIPTRKLAFDMMSKNEQSKQGQWTCPCRSMTMRGQTTGGPAQELPPYKWGEATSPKGEDMGEE